MDTQVRLPVTMRQLLEAGVHFGHQTRRWNPKMKRFIFSERNGIYIIDLQQTIVRLAEAFEFIRDLSQKGGTVLFVGTKKQAQEPVEQEAGRAGMPYVNYRWLGGTLTNFSTIKKRIDRLQQLNDWDDQGYYDTLPKKEVLRLNHERDKLRKNLFGMRDMAKLPQAIFVIDTKKEHIAVTEARRLGIAVVAVVDTNCDPDEVDYIVPGNDDAIRAASLMCRVIADAIVEGRAMLPSQVFEPDAAPTDAAAPAADAATDVASDPGEPSPELEPALKVAEVVEDELSE